MKTEELIKELKLSIHDGINALNPMAKELLREYKMQQLTYAIIGSVLAIVISFVLYKMIKGYLELDKFSDWEIVFMVLAAGLVASVICAITSIVNYVSPVISLIQSLTGD